MVLRSSFILADAGVTVPDGLPVMLFGVAAFLNTKPVLLAGLDFRL